MAMAVLCWLSHQKDQAMMNNPLKNGEIGVMNQRRPTEGMTISTKAAVETTTLCVTDVVMITNMIGMMKVERKVNMTGTDHTMTSMNKTDDLKILQLEPENLHQPLNLILDRNDMSPLITLI